MILIFYKLISQCTAISWRWGFHCSISWTRRFQSFTRIQAPFAQLIFGHHYFVQLFFRGFDGAAIESTAVKRTLIETKKARYQTKISKRCKEKYQKNLFRLSFKPDLANWGRLTKIDSTNWRQRFSTTRNVVFLEYRARHASRVNMGL